MKCLTRLTTSIFHSSISKVMFCRYLGATVPVTIYFIFSSLILRTNSSATTAKSKRVSFTGMRQAAYDVDIVSVGKHLGELVVICFDLHIEFKIVSGMPNSPMTANKALLLTVSWACLKPKKTDGLRCCVPSIF